jgi:glycosyltransferase involved in cell wall biosynthesis
VEGKIAFNLKNEAYGIFTPEKIPVCITEHNWPDGTIPLVSVRTLTYNHEKYISECIEGVLMQRTTFAVEFIIHDDASSDNTAFIISQYQKKYPNLIRVIYQKENQYSKPDFGNLREVTLNKLKGKYVAYCEGDDFWTDPLKLQKQVDFMEKNPDVSLCGHTGNIHVNNKICFPTVTYRKTAYPTMTDLIRYNPFLTASICYRYSILPLPKWTLKLKFGDYPIYFQALTLGKIAILPDNMCTYRIHPGGVWSSHNTFPAGLVRNAKETLKYHRLLKIHYPFSFLEAKANNLRIMELSALIIKMYKCRHLKKYSTTWAICMIPIVFIRFGYEIIKTVTGIITMINKLTKMTSSG